MGRTKSLTMNEFCAEARHLGIKTSQDNLYNFYRFLYKDEVSLELFLDEAVPLSKLFMINAPKSKLTELYNTYKGNEDAVPIGLVLLNDLAVASWKALVEMDAKQEVHKDITPEQFINYILDQDLSEYSSHIKELVGCVDRNELCDLCMSSVESVVEI